MRKFVLLVFCLIIESIYVVAQTSQIHEWQKKRLTQTSSPSLRTSSFDGKELDYGILVGAVNSLTDIGNGTQKITDLQYQTTNVSVGTYVRYRFAKHFGVSGTLNYGKISGHDSLTPDNGPYEQFKQFTNNIVEMAFRGEIYFTRKQYKNGKITEKNNNLYIYGGVAGFYNLPELTISMWGTNNYKNTASIPNEGNTSNGNIVLDSAKNISYSSGYSPSNYCFAVPVGFGVNHTFHNNWRIGLDVGYRFAFTDYLDGFTSSNNTRNDSYMFTNLTIGYVIKYSDTFKLKYGKRKFNKRYYW